MQLAMYVGMYIAKGAETRRDGMVRSSAGIAQLLPSHCATSIGLPARKAADLPGGPHDDATSGESWRRHYPEGLGRDNGSETAC